MPPRPRGDAVSTWSSCTTPRVYDLTGQPDGTYTFSVHATDAAGNTGPVSTSDYRLDATAPPAPTLVATPGAVAANFTPTWSFSGESGAAFECRLDLGAATVSDWAPCSSPRGYNLAGQPDGDYVFSVRVDRPRRQRRGGAAERLPAAHHRSGNAGDRRGAAPDRERRHAVVDVRGRPERELRVPRGPRRLGGGELGAVHEPLHVSARGPAGRRLRAHGAGAQRGGHDRPGRDVLLRAGHRCSRTAGLRHPARSPGADPQADLGLRGRGRRRCRVPPRGAGVGGAVGSVPEPGLVRPPGPPDGDYTLELRATDAAGNVSRSVAGAYELDTTAPGRPSIDAGPGAGGTDRTPTWSFSSEPGAAFQCRLTGVADWAPCTSPKTYDLGDQPAGSYTFSVRATDQAGNDGPVENLTYTLRSASQAASPGSGS